LLLLLLLLQSHPCKQKKGIKLYDLKNTWKAHIEA
jgi:hypothetical protein